MINNKDIAQFLMAWGGICICLNLKPLAIFCFAFCIAELAITPVIVRYLEKKK